MLLELLPFYFCQQLLALFAAVALGSLLVVGWFKPSLLPRHLHAALSHLINVRLE